MMKIAELNQRRKCCEEEIRKQKEMLEQIAEEIMYASMLLDAPSDEELEAIVWAKSKFSLDDWLEA